MQFRKILWICNIGKYYGGVLWEWVDGGGLEGGEETMSLECHLWHFVPSCIREVIWRIFDGTCFPRKMFFHSYFDEPNMGKLENNKIPGGIPQVRFGELRVYTNFTPSLWGREVFNRPSPSYVQKENPSSSSDGLFNQNF